MGDISVILEGVESSESQALLYSTVLQKTIHLLQRVIAVLCNFLDQLLRQYRVGHHTTPERGTRLETKDESKRCENRNQFANSTRA